MIVTATTRGQDELARRGGPEGAQGVDLLRHGHRPELGRDPGADARRDHERRQRGAELAA